MMKKIIPVLAVLGSAVAFAVYKLKKEEQKQLMELDEGLLEDDHVDFHREEPIVHEPIQMQQNEAEEPQEEKQIEIPIAKEIEPDFAPTDKSVEVPVSDIQQLLKEAAQENAAEEAPKAEEAPAAETSAVKEPIVEDHAAQAQQPEEEAYSSEYPHLTLRMVNDINMMTKDAIDALAKDGDVHEHERPVQHMVSFRNKEDMESFKSRVINKGFVITKGEEEFDLIVLHISAIDEVKLVNHILYLADQAYAFNGEYRGWQSKVSF